MSSLEMMVGSLFGIWMIGILLSQFIRPTIDIRSSTVKSKAFNLLYTLPSLLALLLSTNIAWLTRATGLQSIGWGWFTLGNTSMSLTFEFNKFTTPLMVMVSAISFLVHIYSVAYMRNDAAKPRFFATLGLFTFSMLGLTLSGNLLQLFMFWELVGLCSYLLISFYRNKPEVVQAAFKALIINKIGDVGFLISLMILWAMTGTLSIDGLSSSNFSIEWRTIIGTAILIAVLAKSAQFPFHTWLPDAMVGPTPVSALIHSATMVAAGVFLLVRLQFLFTSFTLQLTALLGGITALIGGFNAIRENDLKRFLAWSTLSQLGLMVMVVGANAFSAAFIHLLSHAIFKAGLFLAAGILIQHYHIKSFTDVVTTPTTTLRVLIIVLTLALMGAPFTIGFLSKELLLGSVSSPTIAISISILSLITAFYCSRLLMFIRPTQHTGKQTPIPLPMFFSVSVLVIASFWFFYSWSPLSTGNIAAIFQLTEPASTTAILSIGIIFFGMAAGIGFIRQGRFQSIQNLIPTIPYDNLLKIFFVKPVFVLSEFTTQVDSQIDRGIHLIAYVKVASAHLTAWFDQNIVDGFVHSLPWISKAIGNIFRRLVTGRIQDYIWWTVLGVIIIIVLLAQ